jgi:two-component system chemotaxis sensor kinase CheA
VLLLGGVPTPLRTLADALGCDWPDRASSTGKRLAVVLISGEQEVAFMVDEVNSEHEVLVKSLGPRIRRLRLVSGASLLPSGKVALVLNPGNLVRTAMGQASMRKMAEDTQAQTLAKRRLLLTEDSITTRALMKNILESAGYNVLTAADGQQAWQLLQDQQVDLVVSDVDMPKMNGFELAEAVRNSNSMGELPVILVTARETDEDKMRGLQVGANAYLTKSAFDQTNLLETIQQLL